MEVQMTDFENAAFVVFIALITRVVLAFDLGFYIPLSKVDENMTRAHQKDAVNTQMFFFRKHIAPPEVTAASVNINGTVDDNNTNCGCKGDGGPDLSAEDSCEEMTMNEIFNGKGAYFPGLLPLVYSYLDYIQCDAETFRRVEQYLQFIEKRSKGELLTPATWMRQFVQRHPAYQHDSVVSPEIAHDLMEACNGVGEGSLHVTELLGDIKIDRVRKEDAYGQVLAGRLSSKERSELVKALIKRAGVHRPDHIARGKLRAGSNL
jgi:glutamate--cysteine ligase catalytic subunit